MKIIITKTKHKEIYRVNIWGWGRDIQIKKLYFQG